MDNRRLLLALVLSFGILALWMYFFPTVPPAPPPAATGGPAAESPAQPPIEAEPGDSSGIPPEAAPSEPAVAAGPAAPRELIEADRERTVVVDTPRFRAELSNRGAHFVSFELKEHTSQGGGAVDLVRHRENGPFPFSLVDSALDPLAIDDALFTVEESRVEGEQQVVFRYSGPAGVAEKRFRFHPDGLFKAEVSVDDPAGWGLWLGPGIRNPTPKELENRFEKRGGVYKVGSDITLLNTKSADERVVVPPTGLLWAGLEDHYFLTVIIPSAKTPATAIFQPVLAEQVGDSGNWSFSLAPAADALTSEQKALVHDYALVLQPGAPRLDLEGYWGAKKLERLAALPYGLDGTVNLGYFAFFSRLLFRVLRWIHDNVVANYGWSIILLTVLIKLILLPLTHKSYKSMRKMQELAPKMQAIRERYRPKLKDRQGRPNIEMQRKMNEEVMGLYKSEGVNPAGGCLPMLLQLPVLWAFYNLLSAAVELRNAPWMLWIQDLSAPDPIYALPLIMGATQFLQQRMTPMAGDPMQRRIFQLMPVFMTVLFLGFPSGMVLYWLTNNVLTIAQQAAYNRLRNGRQGGGPSARPMKAKGGRSK